MTTTERAFQPSFDQQSLAAALFDASAPVLTTYQQVMDAALEVSRAAQAARLSDYPEQEVLSSSAAPISLKQPKSLYTICPVGAKWGEDDNRHGVGMEINCSKEWCKRCGGINGLEHDRRKARWYPLATQMVTIGYFVVTIPMDLRYKYRSMAELSKWGTDIKKVFQRHFGRGLRRFHFFGECKQHPDGDCLCTRPWNPHLNIYVDAAYITPELLTQIRQEVADVLHIPLERSNVYYGYRQTVKEKLHAINYGLRPTFLDPYWDEEMAVNIKGLRNMQRWGKWDGDPVWAVPLDDESVPNAYVLAIGGGHCPYPDCGHEIKWHKGIVSARVMRENWAAIGKGYYLRPPESGLSHPEPARWR